MSDPENPVPTGSWQPDEANTPPSLDLPPTPSTDTLPPRIGRYRIERLLGKGGFGLVYLAEDELLSRPVAVNVPHCGVALSPQEARAYLTEARTVANLDHPHIVPVYDTGST
jgi:serine/threonine protein kinase